MATNENTPDDLDLGATIRGFVAGQKLFNRYTLEKILGRGGMGVVWLARDEELGRDIAMKFLPEMVVRDREAIADLKRETNRSLELTHANIVRIHDFVQSENWAGITMEYVEGESLSELKVEQAGRCFDTEQIAPWMEKLCAALTYAHEDARMVHRDLKPANLMVAKSGRLKVADFGIASSLSESASRISMRPSSGGTLAYMSPQQAMGAVPSVADDIYSLGATMYDLLTGKPPFYSGDVMAQLREKVPTSMMEHRNRLQVTGKNPIPEKWEQTVAACLEKDPSKRPQSAGEVAWRLGLVESYTAQPKVEIAKPEVIRVEREVKRGHGALIAVLILLLGCGGFAGWWFGIEQPRRKSEEVMAQARKDYLAGLQFEAGAEGVMLDTHKAVPLIQKSAEQGLPEAEAEMAILLKLGYGLPKDEAKSTEWEKKAVEHGLELKAQSGDAHAEMELGSLYDNGAGVPQDYTKARELYQKAGEQGEYLALYSLGLLYQEGNGVEKDYAKAREFYQKAADEGDSYGLQSLGELYATGEGGPRDEAKARQLYEKAAEQGNPTAMTMLGESYALGQGVTQDYTKALEFFKKSADQGDDEGQYRMGWLYENGHGVEKNNDKAREFYEDAAAQGNVEAKVALVRLPAAEKLDATNSNTDEMGRESAVAKNDETQIVNAINNYYIEYGKYPVLATGTFDTYFGADKTAPKGAALGGTNDLLFDVLRNNTSNAANASAVVMLNPRGIVFLDVTSVKNTSLPTLGVVPNTPTSSASSKVGAWYDQWGSQYNVLINTSYSGQLNNPYTDAPGGAALDKSVIVWAYGKNGALGGGPAVSGASGNFSAEPGTAGVYKDSGDIISWQ